MSVTFTDTALPNIIQLKNISQSYDNGKVQIIKDFELLIEDVPDRGQFVVILGPSGCGKSTVLRYIAGLQKPTTGEVYINGKLRTDDDRIGMVFQQYSSFPWLTVLDNVALGLEYKGVSKKERRERAMEAVKIVGLEGHEHKYAQYPSLSGGQLQRVAIARSLLVNNQIILLDEPFGALDTNTRLRMQDFVIKVWEEVQPTIVFITHDISEAVYLADDIFIMGNAPAQFAEHIDVNLPFHRDRSIKRDKNFVELVHYIEDRMMTLNK
jgi:NitT/TauT family transport system ATP-binding protein